MKNSRFSWDTEHENQWTLRDYMAIDMLLLNVVTERQKQRWESLPVLWMCSQQIVSFRASESGAKQINICMTTAVDFLAMRRDCQNQTEPKLQRRHLTGLCFFVWCLCFAPESEKQRSCVAIQMGFLSSLPPEFKHRFTVHDSQHILQLTWSAKLKLY